MRSSPHPRLWDIQMWRTQRHSPGVLKRGLPGWLKPHPNCVLQTANLFQDSGSRIKSLWMDRVTCIFPLTKWPTQKRVSLFYSGFLFALNPIITPIIIFVRVFQPLYIRSLDSILGLLKLVLGQSLEGWKWTCFHCCKAMDLVKSCGFFEWLVGGWTNPSEKYALQIGSFPQGSE